MEALGIRFKKLEYGAVLNFPIDLSGSQIRRLTTKYQSDGWKIEEMASKIVLRLGEDKIELGRNQAVIVAEGERLSEIHKSLESIYRNTLDRALVFQLAAAESYNSALYNRLRRKFRSCVTDAYYACFNALRAGLALTKSEEEAERLEHPGLQTQAARPEDCEWNLSKRARWVKGVDEVLRAFKEAETESAGSAEARDALDALVVWAGNTFTYDLKGDDKAAYSRAVESSSREAVLVERFLSERLDWLRLRADYRVDFEATTSSHTISEALYGALVFVNVVTSLVKKELAFQMVIRENDEMLRASAVRGQIIDLAYSPGKVARSLLLSEKLVWTASEENPDHVLHAEWRPERTAPKSEARLNVAPAPGTSGTAVTSLTTHGYDLPGYAVESFASLVSAPDQAGVATIELGEEGMFTLWAGREEFSGEVLAFALAELLEVVRQLQPLCFVFLQGNRRVLRERPLRQRRIEEYARRFYAARG